MHKVDLQQKFTLFAEQWQPRIVGELNDQYVKIAKLQGAFVWHRHEGEDELFLVVHGELTIRLKDRDIALSEGQFFIVPRGIDHLPVAEKECHVLLFEPKTVRNTGNVENERTVEHSERI